jgi:uncharacterized cupin superfamily protein
LDEDASKKGGDQAMSPILNIGDLLLTDHGHGEDFAARLGQFGPVIGLKQLGCRLVILPRGNKAWPYHNYHVNKEMFIILDGAGTLRFGGEEHPVKAGDVIACPADGPETAHQLINTGDTELRYLAISTMLQPDIAEYPDSGKFIVMFGSPRGGDKNARRLVHVGRGENGLDHWDGESFCLLKDRSFGHTVHANHRGTTYGPALAMPCDFCHPPSGRSVILSFAALYLAHVSIAIEKGGRGFLRAE